MRNDVVHHLSWADAAQPPALLAFTQRMLPKEGLTGLSPAPAVASLSRRRAIVVTHTFRRPVLVAPAISGELRAPGSPARPERSVWHSCHLHHTERSCPPIQRRPLPSHREEAAMAQWQVAGSAPCGRHGVMPGLRVIGPAPQGLREALDVSPPSTTERPSVSSTSFPLAVASGQVIESKRIIGTCLCQHSGSASAGVKGAPASGRSEW